MELPFFARYICGNQGRDWAFGHEANSQPTRCMCSLLTCVYSMYPVCMCVCWCWEAAHSSGLKLLEKVELRLLHQLCIIYVALSWCLLSNKLWAITRSKSRGVPSCIPSAYEHCQNLNLTTPTSVSLLKALSQWITVRFLCQYFLHFISGAFERECCQSIGYVVCASEPALNEVMSYRGARQGSWLVI